MAVTTTTRLGITQWSAGADPFVRSQMQDSFAALEAKVSGYEQGTVRPAAGSAYAGYFFFNTTSDALSYCDGTIWHDITGGDGNFGSPVALAGDSSLQDGTELTASRSDHVHAMPGFGTPVSTGASNQAGSSPLLARADHVHLTTSVNDPGALGAGVVETAALADNAVTTIKILDNAVTSAKIASLDAAKLTGTVSTGAIPNLAASKITSGTFDSARLPVGNSSTAGALQLSASVTSTSGTGGGIAATPSAVKSAYDLAATKANSSHTHSYASTSHTHDNRYYTEAQSEVRYTNQYWNGSRRTNTPKISVQASAPSSPNAGDIWIDI